MNLTALALRRPVTILMVILALALTGVIAYLNLPVRRFPNVTFPVIQVRVSYPGANPTDVMNLVATPLENSLATVPGLSTMTATSFAGQARVVMQFSSGTNLSVAAEDTNNAVQQALNQLPTGVGMPQIIKANPLILPIMQLGVYGPNHAALSQWAQTVLVPRLEEVSGVGQVSVNGAEAPEVQVYVHPSGLQQLRLSLNQVLSAIGGNNPNTPAGQLTRGSTTYQVKTLGTYGSLQALSQVSVGWVSPSAGQAPIPIPLQRVATIHMTPAPVTSIAQVNGQSAVGISITQQATANSLAVAHLLKQTLATMSLPPGVRVAIVNDSSAYTKASLASVQEDLALAIIFAGLVLLAFLHRIRHTLIVMLAIPTSLLATFAVMALLGFSLDLISLMALSLLIGILVDDSIVVLENIHRHLAMGKAPANAALDGRMEIGAAAVAITLTDVVVYAPMALVTGNIGQIFREFGMTIVAATLFSLFISFTLTPMLASRWLASDTTETRPSRFSQQWDKGFATLRQYYGRVLTWALSHTGATIGIGLAAMAIGLSLIPLGIVNTSFIPPEDTGLYTVNATLPPGTSLSSTNATLTRLSQEIRRLPGVVSTFQVAGLTGSTNTGQVDVSLTIHGARPSVFQLEKDTTALAAQIPNLTITLATANPLVPGNQPPIDVTVTGPSLSTVNRLAMQLTNQIRSVPSLVDVQDTSPIASPELGVSINRAEASNLGVTLQNVGQTVATSVAGSTVTQYRPGTAATEVPIVVSMAPPIVPSRILNMPVASLSGSVPLSAVATTTYGVAATQIQQQNRLYAATVTADLVGAAPIGPADHAIRQRLQNLSMPTGYGVTFGGQSKQKAHAFGPLFEALALSVFLVYMLMAALYESFRLPLSIIMAVPLAGAGALVALGLTGNTLNVFSIIGLIMLMGLVTKNAILLVDYTETLRKRGWARQEALVEAGKTRLRPILMTTATMVFSMLPLALSLGTGSADRSAMAVVVIGGLISSTLLTLVVVPVLYALIDRNPGSSMAPTESV